MANRGRVSNTQDMYDVIKDKSHVLPFLIIEMHIQIMSGLLSSTVNSSVNYVIEQNKFSKFVTPKTDFRHHILDLSLV